MSHSTAARQVDPVGCGRKTRVAGFFRSSARRCAREMALPVWYTTVDGGGVGCSSSGTSGVVGAVWWIPSGNPTPAVGAYIDQGMVLEAACR